MLYEVGMCHTCHFSGIFQISEIANMAHWILFLEKRELNFSFFRNIASAMSALAFKGDVYNQTKPFLS